jgi:hypothetical protein
MNKIVKKYFIPHPANNHKPHFLREKSILAVLMFVILLFLASLLGRYEIKHNHFLASIQSAYLVDLTNSDRASAGLNTLTINNKLIDAAKMKADDMSEKGYFAHVSPEGHSPWYWVEKAGYNYIYAGENLAVNFYQSEDVEDAWMNSPTHRANIVNRHYTEIGIATAEGYYKGNKTMFVVQTFASPNANNTIFDKIIDSTATPVQAAEVEEQTSVKTPSKPLATEESSISGGSTGESVLGEQTNSQDVTTPKNEETFATFSNPNIPIDELDSFETNNNNKPVVYTNWLERMIVSPTQVVRNIYMVIAAIILFSLILKIFIEIRLQHPKNIAYGVMLLAVVIFFIFLTKQIEPSTVIVLGL